MRSALTAMTKNGRCGNSRMQITVAILSRVDYNEKSKNSKVIEKRKAYVLEDDNSPTEKRLHLSLLWG